ncbi:hypothetical protein STEG23_027313, partial [Scotinomys teguina]
MKTRCRSYRSGNKDTRISDIFNTLYSVQGNNQFTDEEVHREGRVRTQSPTTKNYAAKFPTFGEIAGVNTPQVQQGATQVMSTTISRLSVYYPKHQRCLEIGISFSDFRIFAYKNEMPSNITGYCNALDHPPEHD